MWIDSRLEFADNEDVSGSTGTANTTNQVDLFSGSDTVDDLYAPTTRDVGQAPPATYLVVLVTADFATGSTSEVAFQLASDDTASIATGGGQTVHYTSQAYDTGALTAGTVAVVVALPFEGPVYEQFLGLQVVTTTASTTAGSIDAFLTRNPSAWKAYPDADN